VTSHRTTIYHKDDDSDTVYMMKIIYRLL